MWWWGAGEEGTYPSGLPLPHPHAAPPQPGAWIPVRGVCVWQVGGQDGGRPLAPRTPPPPADADSVWPARGVFVCVCSSPRALSLSRSLQLNPFQTRGALSRHHDEAESEAPGPAAGPSPPSHTPTPATLTLTHTQPLEPPHKQPEFDSGVGAWGSVWGGGHGSAGNRGVTTPSFSKHLYLLLSTKQQPQRPLGSLPPWGAKEC